MSHEEDNVYYLIEYRRDPYDTLDWSSLSSKKYSTKAHAIRDMNAEKECGNYYQYRIVKVTQEIFEGY